MSKALDLYAMFYRLAMDEARLDATMAPNETYVTFNDRKAEAMAKAQVLLGDRFDPSVFCRNAEPTPDGVKAGCYQAVLQLQLSETVDECMLVHPLSTDGVGGSTKPHKWSVVNAALPKSGFEAMSECLSFLVTGQGPIAVATLSVDVRIKDVMRSIGGSENRVVCETATQRELRVAVKMLVPLCSQEGADPISVYPILTMAIPGVGKFAPTLIQTVVGAPQPLRRGKPLSAAALAVLCGRTLCVPEVLSSLFAARVPAYVVEVRDDIARIKEIVHRQDENANPNDEISDDREGFHFWDRLERAAGVPSSVSDDQCLGFRNLIAVFYAMNPFKFGASSDRCNCLFEMKYWQMVALFLSVGRHVQGDAFWVRHPCEPDHECGFQLEHLLSNMNADEPPSYEVVWAAEKRRLRLDEHPPQSSHGLAVLTAHMARVGVVVDARRKTYESMCVLRDMSRDDVMRLLMDVVIFTKNQVLCWYRLKPVTIDIVGMMDRMVGAKGSSFVKPDTTYGVLGLHQERDMGRMHSYDEVVTLLVAPIRNTYEDRAVCDGQIGLVLDMCRVSDACDKKSSRGFGHELQRQCVNGVIELKQSLAYKSYCPYYPREYSGFDQNGVTALAANKICRSLFPSSEVGEGPGNTLGRRFLASCQFSKHAFGVLVPDHDYHATFVPVVVDATFYVINTFSECVMLAIRMKVPSLSRHGLRNIHYVPATGTLLLVDMSSTSRGLLTVFQRPLDLTKRVVPTAAACRVTGSLLLRLLSGKADGGVRPEEVVGSMPFLYKGVAQYAEVKAVIAKECARPQDVISVLTKRLGADVVCGADAFPGGDGVLALLLDHFLSPALTYSDLDLREDKNGLISVLVSSCFATCLGMVRGTYDGVFRMLMCVMSNDTFVGLGKTKSYFRDYIRANTGKVLNAMASRVKAVGKTNYEIVLGCVEYGVPATFLWPFITRHTYMSNIVEMLILRGAGVNVRVGKQGAPLMFMLLDSTAGEEWCVQVMCVLVKHGYDLNAEHESMNLLQKALICGYANVVDELIQRGVDPGSAKGVVLDANHMYMSHPHTVEAQAFRALFARKTAQPVVVDLLTDSGADDVVGQKRTVSRGGAGPAKVKREKKTAGK